GACGFCIGSGRDQGSTSGKEKVGSPQARQEGNRCAQGGKAAPGCEGQEVGRTLARSVAASVPSRPRPLSTGGRGIRKRAAAIRARVVPQARLDTAAASSRGLC